MGKSNFKFLKTYYFAQNQKSNVIINLENRLFLRKRYSSWRRGQMGNQ